MQKQQQGYFIKQKKNVKEQLFIVNTDTYKRKNAKKWIQSRPQIQNGYYYWCQQQIYGNLYSCRQCNLTVAAKITTATTSTPSCKNNKNNTPTMR